MSPCAPSIIIRGFPLLINPFQGGVYLRGKQRKTLQGIPWPSGGGVLIRCWHYILLLYFVDYHMVVSWNRGTPKSSILMEFSIINQPFLDTPFISPTLSCLFFAFMLFLPLVRRGDADARLGVFISRRCCGKCSSNAHALFWLNGSLV